jgi:hypothetical protein
MTRVVFAALALVALTVSCRDSDEQTAVSSLSSSTTVNAPTSTTATLLAGTPTTTLSSRTTTTASAGGSTTRPTLKTAPLTIEVEHACVERGRIEKVTVRSTPGFQVSVATQWPDGKAHQEWNAWAVGIIDSKGRYSTSWVVPREAPTGRARTSIAVAGKDKGEPSAAFGDESWRIERDC